MRVGPFALCHGAPVFIARNREWNKKISWGSAMTLREIMTDGRFESEKRALMKKPEFFYGDVIVDRDSDALEGKYKWIRVVGDQHLFPPDMDRIYHLIYL